MKRVGAAAFTLAAGAAGGGVFYSFGLPAAWLTGSMLVVTVLALCKAPVVLHDPLRFAVFLALGVQIGSGFSPDTLPSAAKWPLSLAGLGITVLLVIAASTAFLAKLGKWSKPTAFYASIPGALSYVLALSLRSSADTRQVMLAQMLRLVSLLAILPSLLTVSLHTGNIPVRQSTDLLSVLPLFALGGALAFVLETRKFPAGSLFGGMIASSILHMTGTVSGQMPPTILIPCQIILGVLIGARFVNTDLAFLAKSFVPSFGAFLIAVALSSCAALLVAWGLHLPPGQVVVAFAPGGIEAMTLLAIVLGLDPAFVATHQLARFFGLALMLPLVAKLYLKGPS
jgi:membrane AbrB-like protein